MAEALIRTNQSGAAEIINESRVVVGGLEAASDDDSDLIENYFMKDILKLMKGQEIHSLIEEEQMIWEKSNL